MWIYNAVEASWYKYTSLVSKFSVDFGHLKLNGRYIIMEIIGVVQCTAVKKTRFQV